MGNIYNTHLDHKLSLQLAARKHIPFWFDTCSLAYDNKASGHLISTIKQATATVACSVLQIQIILRAWFRLSTGARSRQIRGWRDLQLYCSM
jgi:hypothetical protein